MDEALKVAKILDIEVNKDEDLEVSGTWVGDNIISINPCKATNYTVLHEIGHVLAGYICCREHCEYVAHGVAIGLSRVYNIDISVDLDSIDVYAGRSREVGSCPAVEMNKDE